MRVWSLSLPLDALIRLVNNNKPNQWRTVDQKRQTICLSLQWTAKRNSPSLSICRSRDRDLSPRITKINQIPRTVDKRTNVYFSVCSTFITIMIKANKDKGQLRCSNSPLNISSCVWTDTGRASMAVELDLFPDGDLLKDLELNIEEESLRCCCSSFPSSIDDIRVECSPGHISRDEAKTKKKKKQNDIFIS